MSPAVGGVRLDSPTVYLRQFFRLGSKAQSHGIWRHAAPMFNLLKVPFPQSEIVRRQTL